MLRFRGCNSFRQRLLLSTLSGKQIRIDDIRAKDENPGLRDYEASLLRLLEKITNGCVVEINETGTTLRYKPGVVVGGGGLVHDCPTTRSISYFLEPLILICLFGKKPLNITLRGVTNDATDPSIDTVRTVTLPLLRKLIGTEDALELKVVRRGAAPLGGGEVVLRVPVVKELPAVSLTDEGMVKRIRGVAFSMKVSPQNANRMVDAARGLLNKLLADVYIFTDAMSGKEAGNSPGYGMTLVAETTSGCFVSAECSASQDQTLPNGVPLLVPEDIGAAAAKLLLEEIKRGGVVDGSHQSLLIMLCALGPEEACMCRLGPLTTQAVSTLRHVKDFLGTTFSLRTENESSTLFLTCLGSGMKNYNRKVT